MSKEGVTKTRMPYQLHEDLALISYVVRQYRAGNEEAHYLLGNSLWRRASAEGLTERSFQSMRCRFCRVLSYKLDDYMSCLDSEAVATLKEMRRKQLLPGGNGRPGGPSLCQPQRAAHLESMASIQDSKPGPSGTRKAPLALAPAEPELASVSALQEAALKSSPTGDIKLEIDTTFTEEQDASPSPPPVAPESAGVTSAAQKVEENTSTAVDAWRSKRAEALRDLSKLFTSMSSEELRRLQALVRIAFSRGLTMGDLDDVLSTHRIEVAQRLVTNRRRVCRSGRSQKK